MEENVRKRLELHNFIDFIYIDDNGEIVKSKIAINE